MSALDQAFIKAYAKNPAPSPAVQAAANLSREPMYEEVESLATDAYSHALPPYRLDQPQQAINAPHVRFARTGNTLRSRYTAPPQVEEFLPPPPMPAVQEYPELLPSPWRKKSLGLTALVRQLAGNVPLAIEDEAPLVVEEPAAEIVAVKATVAIHHPALEPATASQVILNFTESHAVLAPQVLCESLDTTALHAKAIAVESKAELAVVVDTFSEPLAPVVEKKHRRFDGPSSMRAPHFDHKVEEEYELEAASEPAAVVAEKEVPAAKSAVVEQKPAVEPPAVAPPVVEQVVAPPPAVAPKAAWEVDALEWPDVINQLTSDPSSYFAQAGTKLVDAVGDGLRLLAIAGSQRGEGCTTVALALARIAAQSGLDVAVVDADFTHPEIGERLKLEIPAGWEVAAKNNVDLCEVAIRSVKDKLTIYSLRKSEGLSLATPAVHQVLSAVTSRHTLVIVDLGPLPAGDAALLPTNHAAALDAVVIVRDVARTPIDHVQQVAARLHASGIEAVAIAENFTS